MRGPRRRDGSPRGARDSGLGTRGSGLRDGTRIWDGKTRRWPYSAVCRVLRLALPPIDRHRSGHVERMSGGCFGYPAVPGTERFPRTRRPQRPNPGWRARRGDRSRDRARTASANRPDPAGGDRGCVQAVAGFPERPLTPWPARRLRVPALDELADGRSSRRTRPGAAGMERHFRKIGHDNGRAFETDEAGEIGALVQREMKASARRRQVANHRLQPWVVRRESQSAVRADSRPSAVGGQHSAFSIRHSTPRLQPSRLNLRLLTSGLPSGTTRLRLTTGDRLRTAD